MNTRSALAAEFACSRQPAIQRCESHRHKRPPALRVLERRQADFEEEKKDAKLSKDELKVWWTRTWRTLICPPFLWCHLMLKELAAARKPEDQRAKYLAAKNSLKEAAGTA